MLGKLLIPLLVFALLLGAVAAQVAPAAPSPAPAPAELEEEIELEGEEGADEAARYREFEAEVLGEFEAEEREGEEEAELAAEEDETAEEECEEATEEFEEGEIDREELEEGCERQHKRSAHGEPPEKCVLRSSHGHAAVEANGKSLKVTLGYATYEPSPATIDITNLPHTPPLHRQLNHSGVIRFVEHLHENQNPKRLVLEIQIPSVKSAGCPSRRLVLFPR